MRIGIDFDNTIVSYDALFHKVAREQGVVPPNTPANKLAVRDYLRQIGKEDLWTEMQGYVYGERMDEANAYAGVIEFIRLADQAGHKLAIISHKTKHPILGKKCDLHAAARSWVDRHLCTEDERLIPANQVFFELTKEDKLTRISALGCDVFVDDLPEILTSPAFPKSARRILFDPEDHHRDADTSNCVVCKSWNEIEGILIA